MTFWISYFLMLWRLSCFKCSKRGDICVNQLSKHFSHQKIPCGNGYAHVAPCFLTSHLISLIFLIAAAILLRFLSGFVHWATGDVVAQLGRQFIIWNERTADDDYIENTLFFNDKTAELGSGGACLFQYSLSPGNMAASSHRSFFKNMLRYSSFVVVNHQHGLPWKQIERFA